ncbi:transporter substrate-binding domain-containing protein [Pseudoduganella sp. DS3]|uniref:Transporter substrate-binding domain-containing protein n=1 Tax=Pseudoduganella guangdongensis TaxID=2692179 RepID=A0A6N9HR91_9BURK|nr:transporter substrate-binding domain-containing protein [Pseudoduganella guangdongensis]MYN05355.1 transporter substrate-binding domain-containing protein [Pseudoduganella guangdongensis]
MKWKTLLAAACLSLSASHALAACGAFRFAYPDQHRPPYWLGNGAEVANPPGATVELVREFAASAGCAVNFVRLPVMRLRSAVSSGSADFTTVDISADGQAGMVLPRDAQGKPDTKRAATLFVAAFVRIKDGYTRATDPLQMMRGQRVGILHGSTYGPILEQAGAVIDHGAITVPSSFEKLRLGRIDAFVVPLVTASDLDNFVATRFKGEIIRLDKPIVKSYIWFATNRRYYEAHRSEVEAMWNWLGGDGNKRFNQLLRKYAEN